jgi:ketosteroid isomerase-like protein
MSQENVEISRAAMNALNRDGVEAFVQYFAADVEWVTPPDWLEDRVLEGHDGVRLAIALFSEQLDDFRVDLDRVIDVDQDRVVMLLYQRGRIKGSGHTLEQPLGVVNELRDGRATRVQVFFTWDEALQAAGLAG